MTLNIIDFSNGIRPEEIQENFEYLQNQISRERKSVGGAGISSGLEIEVNVTDDTFYINISAGSIIDDEGNEVFLEGTQVQIEPPILYEEKEYCILSKEKTVLLKHEPYSLNRRSPAEELSSFEPEVSGITIRYKNSINKDDFIRVRNIINNELTISGALTRELEILYKYTAKRIDTLYLDENFNIKLKQGTTSTTPSAILPADAKYLIAYLEVDHEYKDENNSSPHAYIYVKDDLRTIRNLYTSSDGTLYICGVPFDDLQIIHLREPKNPKPNTLWLNMTDNTLYCWRATNEFVYKNKIYIDTDFVNNSSADLTFSTYMDFLIGENELSVYLNNAQLKLGIDYEELYKNLPTFAGNEGDSIRGNGFQILQTLERNEQYEDALLIPGDVLTYMIRYKDSEYMWVPVNKMNYIPAKNTKIYSTYYDGIRNEYIYEKNDNEDIAYFDSKLADSYGKDANGYPYKYQYFIFDRNKDLNMHFTPYRKELALMVNQTFLHEDQFEEITVFDLNDLPINKNVLIDLGWTSEAINSYNEEFDNIGIGFKLIEPLDSGLNADTDKYDYGIQNSYEFRDGSSDLFVEAIVERRICSTPVERKLQRSATFVYEDYIAIDDSFNNVINLDKVLYRYNEHQLEVFINGVKQIEGIDYIEQYGYFRENSKDLMDDDIIIPPIDYDEEYQDQEYFIRKKAAICNKFKILENKDINSNSIISYKITTNVYSYDHINNILDGMGDVLTDCKALLENYDVEIEEFKSSINTNVDQLREQVNQLNNLRANYLTQDSILNIGQMPTVIVKNAIKSLDHINTSIILNTNQITYSLKDIWPEDYINVYYHNSENAYDSVWINQIHYQIVALGSSTSYIEVLKPDLINNNDILYITGIKLSNTKRDFE